MKLKNNSTNNQLGVGEREVEHEKDSESEDTKFWLSFFFVENYTSSMPIGFDLHFHSFLFVQIIEVAQSWWIIIPKCHIIISQRPKFVLFSFYLSFSLFSFTSIIKYIPFIQWFFDCFYYFLENEMNFSFIFAH